MDKDNKSDKTIKDDCYAPEETSKNARIITTNDIKEQMHKFEVNMQSAEGPEGDSTRSEE